MNRQQAEQLVGAALNIIVSADSRLAELAHESLQVLSSTSRIVKAIDKAHRGSYGDKGMLRENLEEAKEFAAKAALALKQINNTLDICLKEVSD
jgi:hypothetical protein